MIPQIILGTFITFAKDCPVVIADEVKDNCGNPEVVDWMPK